MVDFDFRAIARAGKLPLRERKRRSSGMDSEARMNATIETGLYNRRENMFNITT
jgi:hypothetical protein